MEVKVTLDMRGLTAGINAAAQYSKRTLPQIVNTSAYWIARNTMNSMPFVTIAQIDKEMGTVVSAKIGVRGNPLKNKKVYSSSRMVSATFGGKTKMVPFAALLVASMASKNPHKVRNILKLTENPFKGVPKVMGNAFMRMLVDKLIKKKHSSIKFLLAGWVQAVRILAPFAVQTFARQNRGSMENAKNYYGTDLGTAMPAQEGFTCAAEIVNYVGMSGSAEKEYNDALLRYGTGPLQNAINREGKIQMDYALDHAGGELRGVVQKHWS
jgi:hypothetical protein